MAFKNYPSGKKKAKTQFSKLLEVLTANPATNGKMVSNAKTLLMVPASGFMPVRLVEDLQSK